MNLQGSSARRFRRCTILFSCLFILIAFPGKEVYAQGLDLSVTKIGPVQAAQGDIVTFTIDLGIGDVAGAIYTTTVTLTDTLPGGVEYFIRSTDWGCGLGSPGSPEVVYTPTVPLGETESLVCQRIMEDGTSSRLTISGTVHTSEPAWVTNTVIATEPGGGSDGDSAALALNQLARRTAVPTVGEWGVLALSLLLAACACGYLRLRKTG